MVVILMGVAGSGKSRVGELLAERLGWTFCDGDDLHPEENRRKMASGAALDDEDRRPWLEAVRAVIERFLAQGENAVVACSALRESYRKQLLVDDPRVKVVYLRGSKELIAERLARRRGHFFPPELLETQFATLEEPKDAITVDVSLTPEEIVEKIREELD